MIDTTKLIPRSKPLNDIKKDVIEIDNLLKERLVIKKVRDGILRQQEERRKRFARESFLEGRKKGGDDGLDVDPKSKKPKSLVGAFISGILNNLSVVALGKMGALLKIGKLLSVALSPKVLIIAGTLAILKNVLNSVAGTKDTLRDADFTKVEGNKTRDKIDNFITALNIMVTSLVVGAVVSRASRARANRLASLREDAIFRSRLREIGKEIKTEKLRKDEAFDNARARADAEFDFKEDIKNRQKADVTYESPADVEVKERAKKRYGSSIERRVEVKAGARNLNVETGSIMGGIEEKQFIRKTRINPNELFKQELKKEKGKIKRGGFNPNTIIGDDFVNFLKNEKIEGNRLVKMDPNGVPLFRDDLGNFRPFSQLSTGEKGTYVSLQNARKSALAKFNRSIEITPKPISKDAAAKFLELRKITPEDKAKRFSQAFGKPTGADPFTGAPTYRVNPRGREIDPVTGMLKAKRAPKKTATTGAKITAKTLKSKGIRGFLARTVGQIPFLGDLIFMLIDIFVFGQPPGRAAFMAVGGALLGFLGGLLGSLAGPAGALALGILGGIGGDMLGGMLYDVMFGSPSRVNPLDRLPRTGFKQFIKGFAEDFKGLFGFAKKARGKSIGGFASFGKYMLGEEGREFVLDADSTASIERNYPGLLMALNKADYGGALDVLKSRAFYEEGAGGSERMLPVPIPIPSSKNQYARSSGVILTRRVPLNNLTYSQLYRRG
jgi:hypothetical protein